MPINSFSNNINSQYETVTNEPNFSSLNTEIQEDIVQLAIDNKNEGFFIDIISEYTGILDFDERTAYWLDSNFNANIWKLKLTKQTKEIRWNEVYLSDGRRLTDKAHSALITTFKLWILATENPRINGGRKHNKYTVYQNVTKVILLINAILLHGDTLKLAQHHLSKLNNNVVMSILIKIAKNGATSVYDFPSILKLFLLENIKSISQKELKDFKEKYPYVLRSIPAEEEVLKLNVEDRIKACCFLKKHGFYHTDDKSQPNNTTLLRYILKGKIICPGNVHLTQISELFIKQQRRNTEFTAVPIQNESGAYLEGTVGNYIRCFKLLIVASKHTDSSSTQIETFKNITLPRITLHTKLEGKGRNLTLPARLVFNAMHNAFHFCFDYMDDILDCTFNILSMAAQEKGKIISKKDNDKIYKINEKCTNIFSKKLLDMGVERYSININKGDIFNFSDLRSNKGFVEIYSILLGSVQILTGSVMARRQDEIIKLKSTGNLTHNQGAIKSSSKQFIDPSSKEGQCLNYSLTFRSKKSGVGGEHGENETLTRPIPRSIAGFIFKLEKFNRKVESTDIKTPKGLALFNTLSLKSPILSKLTVNKFNSNMNLFCDYFKTDCVHYGKELRRYYIREHQLRRFFAMVFFWSKLIYGLDTLRWMLGHTDIEHLYYYVTESQRGEALNGVKASYLTDKVLSNNLEDIDLLRTAIAIRFGVEASNIFISTTTEIIDTYDNDDFETLPTMRDLKSQTALENQIYTLLQDDIITLELEFFTIENADGRIQDFNIILQVRELD